MRHAARLPAVPNPYGGLRQFVHIIWLLIVTGLLGITANSETLAQTLNSTPKLPVTPYQYFTKTPPAKLGTQHSEKKPVKIFDLLAPHVQNPRLNHLATLGRVLFYDRKLSANGLVSCASCHKQTHGFDDISRRSIGFEGKPTSRNAMGLAAARFSFSGRFFWDERATTLEEQVLDPFTDPIEMGLAEKTLIAQIATQPYYRQLYKRAFGDEEITEKATATALSVFVMAIGGYDSAFDQQVANHSDLLQKFSGFSEPQNRGKFLFFSSIESGGAGCSQCHEGQHFMVRQKGRNNGLDTVSLDLGTGSITKDKQDIGKFRPPSLRNIALRAPYMHDGRFESLSQVIDHYSSGIKDHPNLDPVLKDVSGKPLSIQLSSEDKNALVAFLETLTDLSLVEDDRFSNPFLSK